MNGIYFMYDMISAVRHAAAGTQITHKKAAGQSAADNYHTAQSYDEIRQIFMRDCTVLSAQQYIHDRIIMSNRTMFLEFQSMDSIHEGETVLVNPCDIMSYGGSTNDGGVYISTFSGLMFVMPFELKAFAHAHDWHRRHGRGAPSQHPSNIQAA
jgi:hypothetical protein